MGYYSNEFIESSGRSGKSLSVGIYLREENTDDGWCCGGKKEVDKIGDTIFYEVSIKKFTTKVMFE